MIKKCSALQNWNIFNKCKPQAAASENLLHEASQILDKPLLNQENVNDDVNNFRGNEAVAMFEP